MFLVRSNGLPRLLWAILLLVSFSSGTLAQQISQGKKSADLSGASLEDLMNIEVVSASKKEEKLFDTAAAIFVITQEDIRRSGLTSLPEVLRLAPGLQVARIDSNRWAIASRGFNSRFNNKMLLLIDGRTISAGSVIYWETIDLVLEDIERIEIIRGPGGTLWGANAQNGVINFITKKTEHTRGGLQSAQVGTEENGVGLIRFGASIGLNANYRLYAKYLNRRSAVNAFGGDLNEKYAGLQGGGRIDWQISRRDVLTFHGGIFNVGLRENSTVVRPLDPLSPSGNSEAGFEGGNGLVRWDRTLSSDSSITLKAYFDRIRQSSIQIDSRFDTYDIDFQHRLARRRHEIVWGLGYRRISDQTNGNSGTPSEFFPAGQSIQLLSGFVQDEITAVKNRLRVILGSKFERNDFIGFDAQPNIRVAWAPGRNQSVWGAISRAIRTQSRYERGSRFNLQAFPGENGLSVIAAVFGNLSARSEVLYGYEMGYRAQPATRLSIDATAYYNTYQRLNSIDSGLPKLVTDPVPFILFPLGYANGANGKTYGFEGVANLDLTSRWRLQGSYTIGRVFYRYKDRNLTPIQQIWESSFSGNNPRHQFQIHSYLKLPRNWEFDSGLYSVSRLPYQNVPSYLRLDTRIGWRISERVEWSMGARNLLDDRHSEFTGPDTFLLPAEIQRSFFGKLTWRF